MLGQIVMVCFLISISFGTEFVVSKVVEKRSDIDLQTCIKNFEVHKDKIIRTQDSKNMGAKYINEIDLGSRVECLRLCCETENCDVFVFEEKNAGSCYLFQCGPPEDFKCKFTHHANYSSAILGVNRHVPDLESQIKLTKHEKELAKLSFRKSQPEGDAEKNKSPEIKTTPSTTTITEVKVAPVSPTKPILVENTDTTKCSRYQFECRSTKECIAIYNACDGIPQCADGSDEGPELECPEALTTPQPTRVRQSQLAYEDTNGNMNRPIVPQQYPNQKFYPPTNPQRELPNLSPPHSQRPESDFLRPDVRAGFIPRPAPPAYESPNLPQYQQMPPPAQSNWLPRQPNQIPQPYQPFEDRNSHIFNHKENGLQVSEGQDLRYNKHKGALQVLHRALGYSSAGQTQYPDNSAKDAPRIGSYLDEVYRQNSQYQEKWPKAVQDDRFGNRNQYMPDMGQNRLDSWPQQNIPVQQVPENNERSKLYLQEETPDTWKAEKTLKTPHADHEHEKMAHELKQSKNLMEKASDTAQIKIEKIKTHTHEHLDAQYPKVAAYKVAEVLDLQDGITETPGGAVLSLTLGLIITCVMALLIGCRLRVVRRRLRRGGKSYAHDADYLVNGMYL
ncbi:uncharacterized protein LOC116175584 isoform X2 [Photinus pyralis]|uniref:uncharacterized protein LOC116175584 isoform X2 n=1 Tax=Photinus pyralis TaxID=7054 RepID=UPI0012673D87|nr:uncharacterized protein LOC116175584 isoform X2 [Photinus pyralis]